MLPVVDGIAQVPGPYRLVRKYGNRQFGTNPLWSFLPKNVEEFFEEIIADDAILKDAYIPYRYELTGNDNVMTSLDGDKWVADDILHPLAEQLRASLSDYAELHFASALFKRIDQVVVNLAPTSSGNLPPPLPERRLFFLQAGIGAGKTTLVHHFSRITAPALMKEKAIPYRFVTAVVNCDPVAVDSSMRDLWPMVLREVRLSIGQATGLDTAEGWEQIAYEDIYDPNGSLKPAVRWSPKGEESAKREITYQVHDNDLLFIQRTARQLWQSSPKGIIVVVLDNLDRHQIPWNRQLGMCFRLTDLLTSCRHLIGVIPLRQYTLGNIAQIKSATRYAHLDRMRITTPVVGKVLQRRLELFIDQKLNKKDLSRTFKISRDITFTFQDFRELVKWIAGSIDDHDSLGRKRAYTPEEYALMRSSVSNFLNSVNCFDLRATLRMMMPALRSWAFLVQNSILAFLINRESKRPRQAAKVTLDEILRLVFAGEWERYDEGNDSGIINLFGRPGERPIPEAGRFPQLIRYRLLEYYDANSSISGERTVMLEELRKHMKIFGYSANEIDLLIMDSMYKGFAESPEGMKKKNIKNLFKTQKTGYYLHPLCKLLVYLENVRNDSMITYESVPHEVRSRIPDDLIEILKFIDFIFQSEIAELAYIRKKDKGRHGGPNLRVYRRYFVGTQPICWRLLRSVTRRVNELSFKRRINFSAEQAKVVERYLASLRKRIIEANSDGKLLPKIPEAKKGLFLKISA